MISPSRWLANCAKESSLFENVDIRVIPFGLDTSVYRPLDKNTARSFLNLPQDKILILFGAFSATSDTRKGWDLLSHALQKIYRRESYRKVELVIFGASCFKEPTDLEFKTHFLGELYDDISLCLSYSAADMMIVPSRQEAFGQTASEAMSCGVPVVAFDKTGLSDIVDHKKTGYLAEPYSVKDLAEGIMWLVDASQQQKNAMSKNARIKAEKFFSQITQATQYERLFQEVCK